MRDILNHMKTEVTEEKLLEHNVPQEKFEETAQKMFKKSFRELSASEAEDVRVELQRQLYDIEAKANEAKKQFELKYRDIVTGKTSSGMDTLSGGTFSSREEAEAKAKKKGYTNYWVSEVDEAIECIEESQKDGKFVHVFFRIDAGYKWGAGMPADKTQAFFEEIGGIFEAAGWDVKMGDSISGCPIATKGLENLYCHPMDISGWILETSVKGVEKAMQAGTTFTLRTVDIVGEGYHYTPEEFKAELQKLKPAFEAELLARFQTPRRNLVKRLSGMTVLDLGRKLERDAKAVHASGSSSNAKGNEGLAQQFVTQTMEDLVAQGKMTKHGNDMYRTVTANDMKRAAKKPLPPMESKVNETATCSRCGETHSDMNKKKSGEIVCDKCVDKTYKQLDDYNGIKVGDIVVEDSPGDFIHNRPAKVTAIYTHELLDGKVAALVDDASAKPQFSHVSVYADRLKKANESKVNEAGSSELFCLSHVYVPDWQRTLQETDPDLAGEKVMGIMQAKLPKTWNVTVQEAVNQDVSESKVNEAGQSLYVLTMDSESKQWMTVGSSPKQCLQLLYKKWDANQNWSMKGREWEEKKLAKDYAKEGSPLEDYYGAHIRKVHIGGAYMEDEDDTNRIEGVAIESKMNEDLKTMSREQLYDKLDVLLNDFFGEILGQEGIKTGDIAPEESLRYDQAMQEIVDVLVGMVDGNRPAMESKVNELRGSDLDISGKVGDLHSDAEWPMYSYDTPAFTFWNGFANGMRSAGYNEQQIKIVLQSKLVRWMFDANGDQVEALGRKMGRQMGADKKGLQELFAEAKQMGESVAKKLMEKYGLTPKHLPIAKVMEMAGQVIDPASKEKFMDLACALSPENLHCDGEISPAQARMKYKELMKEWKALEQKVGRQVSEDEVWQWSMKEHQ